MRSDPSTLTAMRRPSGRHGRESAKRDAMPRRVLLSWSGGKDGALALHALAQGPDSVVGLMCTFTEEHDRVTMHGVRRDVMVEQAAALGLPLDVVGIPPRCSLDAYGARMRRALGRYRRRGVRDVAFGDLFLEEVRAYREQRLALVGMRAHFPLWRRDTRQLARDFLALGFRAVVVCVDTAVLPHQLAGREYDASFLRALPPGADPCGENGEFHTFVYAGPVFRRPVSIRRGEVVLRDSRFAFCDLRLPKRRPEFPSPASQEESGNADERH